jgi:leucyl-tRNA synthetase
MEQWFLRITDYAERLINDLDGLDWPEATIKRQLDWLGRSDGSILNFKIKDSDLNVEVFTTRADTLFGATFLVLAPEHDLIKQIWEKILNKEEVQKYIEDSLHKTELMRQEEAREKTGVEILGVKAVNPATKEEIPIFMADYVLMGYGTGAIMGVPAHDTRDFEFAKKYNLKIKQVIKPEKEDINLDSAYVEDGILINSEEFNGLTSKEARPKITENFKGKILIQYKLRDWSVSRQRYWGVPIPMIYCHHCFEEKNKNGEIENLKYGIDYTKFDDLGYMIYPVLEKDLPVILPDLEDYRPKGKPPLASSKDFIKTTCPKCGSEARRDVETLDTFVDSSWYYLRYPDAHNDKEIFSREKVDYWMPVDLYIIGAEHTVLHLLYSRFITKFLYDLGLVKFKEPFLKIRHQGLILGTDGQKMSKSRGNVINPDDVVREFGADTFRMYEMFMGPFEDAAPWSTKGILGVHRFLNRFWNWANSLIKEFNSGKDFETDKESKRLIHQTILKTTNDILNFNFNTAISSFMILSNNLKDKKIARKDFEIILKIMHPFTPHITQELWSSLGNNSYIDNESWPQYDKDLILEEEVNLVIQINGKMRDVLKVKRGILENEALNLALQSKKVQNFLKGQNPKKVIYLQNKILNIII